MVSIHSPSLFVVLRINCVAGDELFCSAQKTRFLITGKVEIILCLVPLQRFSTHHYDVLDEGTLYSPYLSLLLCLTIFSFCLPILRSSSTFLASSLFPNLSLNLSHNVFLNLSFFPSPSIWGQNKSVSSAIVSTVAGEHSGGRVNMLLCYSVWSQCLFSSSVVSMNTQRHKAKDSH